MSIPFSLMFYNTENFYDTANDPYTMDDEFTPHGEMNWTEKRFNDKVTKFTNVVKDIVKPLTPDIIGLAEIENKMVIMSILDEFRLHGLQKYSFVHYDSPDERGVDIAMIYNTESFLVLESNPILVHLPGVEDRTRDILHIKGKTITDVILHLFIVHFPSRREGTDRSEPRRYFVASELRNGIKKTLSENPDENIVIMGDFNDTPDDNSIDKVLGAEKSFENISKHKLYNLMYIRHKRGIGSIFYKKWLLFDQFIVSGNVLLSDKIDCKPEYAGVFNPPYLIHFDKKGRANTNRTYRGKYTGGYSDHLPIFLKMQLR